MLFLCAALLVAFSCAQGPVAVGTAPNPEWGRQPFPATGSTGIRGDKGPRGASTYFATGPEVHSVQEVHSGNVIGRDAAMVVHQDNISSYNSTRAYSGKGTPINGTWDEAHEKNAEVCCRVWYPFQLLVSQL